MKTEKLTVMVALFLFLGCSTLELPLQVTIAHRTNPTPGESKSIGGYSSGCLLGGKTFSGKEKGIVISQKRRGRFWAHSQLIDLLVETGEFSHQRFKKKIILGDLSLSRGGPTFGGHNSHQNGLDVDIWFEMASKEPPMNIVETQEMKTVLVKNGFNKDFSESTEIILKFLSQDSRVARIFVHPEIKRYLCVEKSNLFSVESLRKIRPWYGHDDHLHLRLKCPESDTQCINQTDPPEGSGCDQLDWWFSEEAKLESSKRVYTYDSQKDDYIEKNKNLPQECQEIYRDQLL